MAHDPSTCECCRWAAERLGISLKTTAHEASDGLILVDFGAPISFCTSLDAVAGLLRELCRETWSLFWSKTHNKWSVWTFDDERSPIYSETNDENDYSCVIKAARIVLGDKESDDVPHDG